MLNISSLVFWTFAKYSCSQLSYFLLFLETFFLEILISEFVPHVRKSLNAINLKFMIIRKEPRRENHQRAFCRYLGALTVVIIKENHIHTTNLQGHRKWRLFLFLNPGVLLCIGEAMVNLTWFQQKTMLNSRLPVNHQDKFPSKFFFGKNKFRFKKPFEKKKKLHFYGFCLRHSLYKMMMWRAVLQYIPNAEKTYF